jgi:hypothetical protein
MMDIEEFSLEDIYMNTHEIIKNIEVDIIEFKCSN